ncbi:MAG: ABC transporter permease [Gemmatimonadetes bacterium]|nr:ABC transporter permease [Gemmatimonadota bacterium]
MTGGLGRRPTEELRVVERGVVALLRPYARFTTGFFRAIGERAIFLRDTVRATGEGRTWGPEVVKHMRGIGVDSVPLTCMVAAFIGSVIALQTRYQLFPGIQLSVVGFISRQMIVLEMAPLITALVLAGRVGARITAEIGTMRVTEQIDALETLAFDPLAYLVVPRVVAAFYMLPLLAILAMAVGLTAAWLTAALATDMTSAQFREGLRLEFRYFQVFYCLLKAFLFGGAISFLCSYEGYVTTAGAEGVGRATAKAVVIGCVSVLILDALIAVLLAPYLQG